MTTSACQVRPLALPVLPDSAPANPNGATGPRDIAAVKMLRISVTDVCNLRCVYCMPEEGVEFLGKQNQLSYGEIATVVRAAARLGVTHFKLTGGEPTARRDLPQLVRLLKERPEEVRDLSLTTNGILLNHDLLRELKDGGLDRITISLDSLKPEVFARVTRGGDFNRVWSAIERACRMGFQRVKINVVVLRGINDDEVPDLAALTQRLPLTVRFIEFMPLGRSGLTDDPTTAMVMEEETRDRIEARFGPLMSLGAGSDGGVGPAKVFYLPGACGRIGFISAMSKPFCDTCNRLRLTADGVLRSCLFDGGEVDIKPLLRSATPEPAFVTEHKIAAAMEECVRLKPTTHSGHGNKAMNRIGG